MSVRQFDTSPSLHSPVRRIFEQAHQHDEKNVLLKTIKLDTYTSAVKNELRKNPESGAAELAHLLQYAAAADRVVASDTLASPTDLFRYISNSAFTTEKALLPLFFGSNNNRIRHVRAVIANGMSGKFSEITEQILNLKAGFTPHDMKSSPDEYAAVRGALQENTVAALLNIEDDADFIVLPARAEDDLLRGTDLVAYFKASDGRNYRSGISVKSSEGGAAVEWSKWQSRNPRLIILHSEQFDNYNYAVSRLYTRYMNGESLNDADTSTIQQSALKLREEFNSQVERKGATLHPKTPAHVLNAIEAAVFHKK